LLGWQRAYTELLSHERMGDLRNITFETNGTQTLQGRFIDYLLEWGDIAGNQVTFSVSPKLSASGEVWDEAIRPEIVRMYQDYGFTYLKFVVETEQHFAEVDKAVAQYRAVGFNGPVFVMPQGGVVTPYAQNRVKVADWALSKEPTGIPNYEAEFNEKWKAFQKSGLLQFVNSILHVFGYAITIFKNADNKILGVLPRRCSYRGFSDKDTTQMYFRLHKYTQENAPSIMNDAFTTEEKQELGSK